MMINDSTYEYAQNYSIKNSITEVIDFKVIRNEKYGDWHKFYEWCYLR